MSAAHGAMGASGRAAAPCRAQHGERIALRTRTGLVTDRRRVQGTGGGEIVIDDYVACLSRVGRRVPLGRSTGFSASGSSISDFEISGPFVTFVFRFGDKYHGIVATKVEQADLRTGKRTFTASLGFENELQRSNPSANNSTPELVTASDGYAAWVVEEPACRVLTPCGRLERLVARDSLGIHTIATYGPAASGPPPQITNLRITKNDVTWLHLGEPQSARLS